MHPPGDSPARVAVLSFTRLLVMYSYHTFRFTNVEDFGTI